MSISQSQKLDLLYKQAFGVTKTDTEANKSPSNESIPSPLLIKVVVYLLPQQVWLLVLRFLLQERLFYPLGLDSLIVVCNGLL